MSDRVLLVADDLFELSTISAALKLHGTNVVGEAHNASMASSMQKNLQPNVVVIDMHVAQDDSIAIAITARKENPEIGIVILLSCIDLRLLGQIASEIPRASKLVLKKGVTNVSALCSIITDSRAHQSNASISWINGNVSIDSGKIYKTISQLTDIQVATLRHVAEGLTNAEIGRLRFVSEKAIEQIISRISQVINIQPDRSKNMRVQLVNEYFKWIGAPKH